MTGIRIKPSDAAYRKAAKEKLIKTANLVSTNSKLTNLFTPSGTSVLRCGVATRFFSTGKYIFLVPTHVSQIIILLPPYIYYTLLFKKVIFNLLL